MGDVIGNWDQLKREQEPVTVIRNDHEVIVLEYNEPPLKNGETLKLPDVTVTIKS